MNGPTHKAISAITGVATLAIDNDPGRQSPIHNPLIATPLATFGGMLPDLLEPASRGPHHRKFFHSIAVLGTVGYGMYRVYQWQPETDKQKCLRAIALLLGVGYLSHLVADSLTPRSLPII